MRIRPRNYYSLAPYCKRRVQLQNSARDVTTSLSTHKCTVSDIYPNQPGYIGDRWTYLLEIEFDPANGQFTRDMMNAVAGTVFRLDTKTDIINARGLRMIEIVCTPKTRSKRDLRDFPEPMMTDIRPPWETVSASQRTRYPVTLSNHSAPAVEVAEIEAALEIAPEPVVVAPPVPVEKEAPTLLTRIWRFLSQ